MQQMRLARAWSPRQNQDWLLPGNAITHAELRARRAGVDATGARFEFGKCQVALWWEEHGAMHEVLTNNQLRHPYATHCVA
jgi:hypothetical protein